MILTTVNWVQIIFFISDNDNKREDKETITDIFSYISVTDKNYTYNKWRKFYKKMKNTKRLIEIKFISHENNFWVIQILSLKK